ncbi:MAG TPA: metallophosphoesterase [Lacunisphaera sp.]|nr:metallophosphoesterase [Lacunisphaera sp.]
MSGAILPRRRFLRLAGLAGLGLALVSTVVGATAHLLILHTNDLHDHLRPGPGDQGGMPWVAGYVAQVRAERSDVLVLDAGDVTEKGDLVAARSDHRMNYEALRRIGYDAVTIGNHDHDAGVAGLRAYEQALGQPLLCLNLVRPDGTPEFTPSRVVQVGALKVGIIGLIVPRPPEAGGLDFEASGRALAREAARLRGQVHLLIALCHEGSRNCARWSQMAPEVDVFVSGHTHELLPAPVTVPGTGALIVQAGSYAQWVGRLELTIDLDARKVVGAAGTVVPLRHDRIHADESMLAWVREREKALCPEAAEVVVPHTGQVAMDAVAWLGAEALRQQAGTDVGFCHAGQVIRSPIFAGPVDVNALYVAGGDRGDATVRTELTGDEIGAYVALLAAEKDNRTNWSGFRVEAVASAPGSARAADILVPGRTYTVILPRLEWETRFLRAAKRAREKHLGGPLAAHEFSAQPAPAVTFTGAMRQYLGRLAQAGTSPAAEAARLAAAAGAAPAPADERLPGPEAN